MKIFGIAGSLRRKSYNRGLLRAAVELVPDGVTLQTLDLEGIPMFNEDHELEPPQQVVKLKEGVRDADAILIATPEYNYSVPGVLKNAIDWASRPHGQSAWKDKPVAIMGASPGRMGTCRAQYHLRQMCVFLNMHPMNQPEVMVTSAANKFDSEGNLTDEETKDRIRKVLAALAAWTRRLGRGQTAAG